LRPQFDPKGWIHWPDNEDFSTEFMRLLGAAQESGSTVSECFLTASRIDPHDEESWFREWKKTADASIERGDRALARGHFLTAQSNWLRGTNYYNAAIFPLDCSDDRRQTVLPMMRACARRYLKHRTPAGSVVEIPWLEGYPLEGYFLPAANAPSPTPVIICIGEPGHRKEEYLYKMTRYAGERGIALLAVDLLGSGTGADFDHVVGRPDLETSVSHIMDYLTTRDDVDKTRIAIHGDSSGSFVARGVALDDRFAAAVCDGGIWDLQEREFLNKRILSRDAEVFSGPEYGRASSSLKCPVLITIGEHGWLEADHVSGLFAQIKSDQPDVTLKIFRAADTAASQGHIDNPTLANEFIFDWLASRLRIDAGSRKSLLDRWEAVLAHVEQ
jgi:dienelactone hydrolase